MRPVGMHLATLPLSVRRGIFDEIIFVIAEIGGFWDRARLVFRQGGDILGGHELNASAAGAAGPSAPSSGPKPAGRRQRHMTNAIRTPVASFHPFLDYDPILVMRSAKSKKQRRRRCSSDRLTPDQSGGIVARTAPTMEWAR